MHDKRAVAEARNVRGLGSQTEGIVGKSPASGLATYASLELGAGKTSFQQRLQLAQSQGMTLREFEKLLA
jgi:hypothetical protein